MKILEIPSPTLKKKSTPIDLVDKKLVKFIRELEQTLKNKKDPEGVGLSAPQVGKNLRVFATLLDHGDGERKIRTYINPQITKSSAKLTLGPDPKKPFMEGCLSIPEIWAPVQRHEWVKIDYYALPPNSNPGINNPGIVNASKYLVKRSKRFKSFPARVIQHEIDHLDGILFTERSVLQGLPLYKEEDDGQFVEIDLDQS